MIFWQLFFEFFVTGLFSIGGGLAALPFLYKIADKYTWFQAEILPNMVAISESTPGPIGINMATYAGFHAAGLTDALIATISLALPSFLIIICISRPLYRIKDHYLTKSVLYTLRPIVTGLIAVSCWEVMKITLFHFSADNVSVLFNWMTIAVIAVTWFLYQKYKAHPIFYIAACAAVGIALKL